MNPLRLPGKRRLRRTMRPWTKSLRDAATGRSKCGRSTIAMRRGRNANTGFPARHANAWMPPTSSGRSEMAHNQDWREWLESLNASGVEYVVVRYTGDIDVLVRAVPANAERTLAALRRFGFGSLSLTAADLSTPDRVVQLGFPPGRIDVLTSIDGLTWDEVDAGAVAGDYGGVPVRFISREDLIRTAERARSRRSDGSRLPSLVHARALTPSACRRRPAPGPPSASPPRAARGSRPSTRGANPAARHRRS